jgi:hypothetical protein
MANWRALETAAPEIAVEATARFDRHGLVLLGTLRADGWPRISPIEPFIADDSLFLTMMWRSTKALDLFRDPRCLVHSVVANRDGHDGEVKLYGTATDVEDVEVRRLVGDAVEARIKWRPPVDLAHYFRMDIQRAAYVVFDQRGAHITAWEEGTPGVREWVRRD